MIKKGDKVKIINPQLDEDKEKIYTVSTEPEMMCGMLSVWLAEYCGFYSVDKLAKVN